MSQVVIGDILPYTQAIAIASQTVFSTNWTANTESDVVVYKTPVGDAADDLTQQLQYPADYSVAFIGAEEEAQVTLTTGAAAGDIITIVRDTPADRLNLYSNTNFTPSMLNNDFGILTLVDQQAQLVDQKIAPRYNYSALIEDVVDTILPVLEANETWVKNPGNTAIIPYELPAGGIAPSDATYITATDETASLPNSYVMSGTSNQIVTSNGNISISPNPIIPGTAGISIPQGTTAQRVIPSFGVGLRYNTTTGQFEFWNGVAWAALEDSGLQHNYIYVGDPSNFAAAVPMSGDATIVSSGAVTVSKINSVPISLAGAFSTLGAFTAALTFTANTAVTFPTTGTLATTSQLPTGAALTKADDTNVTLTLGGTPASALLQAVSLTLGWTGTLSGTRGGTGINNGSNTITIGGNLNFASSFTTSGSFAVTQTYSGITNVTFPTTGTLATTSQIPTGAALTRVDDTNVTLTLGGSPSTALINAASITVGWSGVLAGTRGGTGVNNGSNTVTYAGNLNFAGAFTTVGAFAVTQTYTGVTNVTFPTSGTLATTTGTISNADNINITNDNSTNATMYPLWVTTTSGYLPAKVSSTKMIFNPSTGAFSLNNASPDATVLANITLTGSGKAGGLYVNGTCTQIRSNEQHGIWTDFNFSPTSNVFGFSSSFRDSTILSPPIGVTIADFAQILLAAPFNSGVGIVDKCWAIYSLLSTAGNENYGVYIEGDSAFGSGLPPLNTIDIHGNLSVGFPNSAAPTDGLAVNGQVVFGSDTIAASDYFRISTSKGTDSGLASILHFSMNTLEAFSNSDELNMIRLEGGTVATGSGSLTGLKYYTIKMSAPFKTGNGTFSEAYGIHITGMASIATTQVSAYFHAPTGGTTNIALFADNVAIGSVVNPPSSGLAVSGISLFGHSTVVNDARLPVQLNATAANERYFAANKAGSAAAIFGFSNGGTRGTGAVIGAVTTDPILFYVNSTTEAARINSSGQFLFNATTSTYGASVEMGGAARISFALVGTKTATDGSNQFGQILNPTFAPISNTTAVAVSATYAQVDPPTGVTITTAYAHLIQSGAQGGLGTVSTGINFFVENAGFGSSRICAVFNGPTTVNTSTVDGTSKLTVDGGISVFERTDGYGLISVNENANAGINLFRTSNSSGVNSSALQLIHTRGTYASPSATQNNDILGAIDFGGYTNQINAPGAVIIGSAAQTWTASAAGTDLSFYVTNTGSLTNALSLTLSANGNVVCGGNNGAALATNANDGFFYVPSGAGTPTGTPTAYTGRIAAYYDTSANKIWFYNGSWRGVLVA